MQNTMFRALAALALVAMIALPAVADDAPATPQENLIKAKAGTVVALKYVLSMDFQGQTQEQNASATGVMIDGSGLILTSASNFSALSLVPRRMRRMMRGRFDNLKAVPTNLRVIFPGEEQEHPAILGAKDSKFGLAFVLIKDLGEKKVASLDLENVGEPRVGETLYGVSRLGQGFDYAPICDLVRVLGKVQKPRELWVLNTTGGFDAEPLYRADGTVVGICVLQDGVGEGAGSRPCVLPLKIARATVRRALKDSQAALDEVLEAEEEAAAEASDEEGAEDGGDDEKKADDKKDGEGDKPAKEDGKDG